MTFNNSSTEGEAVGYYLLKGKHFAKDKLERDAYELASTFWLKFWNDLFRKNGASPVFYDELLRQDYMSVIIHQGKVVGMQCYSIYDLSIPAFASHPYFSKYYPMEFWQTLKSRGVSDYIMTLEYMAINPEFNVRQTRIQFASILLDLAVFVAKSLNVGAVVTAARKDVPASNIVVKHGGEVVIANIDLHNTPCDLICMLPENFTLSVRGTEQDLAHTLWMNRAGLPLDNVSLGIAA